MRPQAAFLTDWLLPNQYDQALAFARRERRASKLRTLRQYAPQRLGPKTDLTNAITAFTPRNPQQVVIDQTFKRESRWGHCPRACRGSTSAVRRTRRPANETMEKIYKARIPEPHWYLQIVGVDSGVRHEQRGTWHSCPLKSAHPCGNVQFDGFNGRPTPASRPSRRCRPCPRPSRWREPPCPALWTRTSSHSGP